MRTGGICRARWPKGGRLPGRDERPGERQIASALVCLLAHREYPTHGAAAEAFAPLPTRSRAREVAPAAAEPSEASRCVYTLGAESI